MTPCDKTAHSVSRVGCDLFMHVPGEGRDPGWGAITEKENRFTHAGTPVTQRLAMILQHFQRFPDFSVLHP